MGHGKIRVDFGRTLEVWQSGGRAFGIDKLQRGAVGFQCLQRRRRGVGKRCRVLLEGRDRLADTRSEPGADLTQDSQHVFLPRGLRLLLVEDVSGVASLGAQP